MTQQEMEWIDAYIDNKLSAEERGEFEAELAKNAQFARDFEEQREIRKVINQYVRAKQAYDASRAQLEAEGFFEKLWEEEPDVEITTGRPARPERPLKVYVWWTVLALVIMILLVVLADLVRHLMS
jgi:anti-sigma factor RsiW